jgi:3-hydroxyisobutyrate dehydrogenase-like beta-hydroxyacid dehydrogenase
MDVAVIGLGGMGAGLASSLIKAGHKVSVWNRSPDPLQALVDQGAIKLDAPKDAFQAQAVVTMLSNDEAVRAVVVDSGALDGAASGVVHVLCSTISVALAQELEALHAKAGVGYVAAPVLGRPDVAAKGELNILAAGDADALAKVEPLLDAIGKQTWPLGDEPHKANVAKLAMNFMIASAIETMAEAFALSHKYGVDSQKLLEVATGTLFAAPVYKTYGGFIVDKKYEPAAFKLTLGLKDARLAQQAGEAIGAPMPLASLIRDNFIDAVAHGDGEKDWAALATVAYRRAGIDT